MKILICGVPTQKVALVNATFTDADVRAICNEETERAWLRLVVPADLCIIVPRHMAHKQMLIVQRVFQRSYVNAASVKDAIRIATEALQTERES